MTSSTIRSKRPSGGTLQALGAVGRGIDDIAFAGEEVGKRESHIGPVFDQQNTQVHRWAPAGATGARKMNRSPFMGSLFT